MKEWVANNIDYWKEDNPSWFNIEFIPDEFFPKAVIEAEGGASRKRRRSSVSLREIVGLEERTADIRRVHPQSVEIITT